MKKLFCALFGILVAATSLSAQEQELLARFEVTQGSSDIGTTPMRLVLLLYKKGREVVGERIEGGKSSLVGLGTFESVRLTRKLESLTLPKIDYQKYFEQLEKTPPKKGREQVLAVDGQEVEVELRVKGTVVKFKMWNPDAFFFNHSDDKTAEAVKTAVDAIVLELGKPLVFF